MQQRIYQQKVIRAVEAGWREFDRQLVSLPTGSGKTCIFSWIAERTLPKRTLILAHRDELVDQAISKTFAAAHIFADKEKAEFKASLKSDVVVSSIQTMIRRLDKWPADHFGLVVADECFPAGTLVDGKPIESLSIGDTVHTHNGLGRVTHTFKSKTASICKITLWSGRVIVCTPNHPIWTSHGFVCAERLQDNCMVATITKYESLPLLQNANSRQEKNLRLQAVQVGTLKSDNPKILQETRRGDHKVQEDKRDARSKSESTCLDEAESDGMEADGQRWEWSPTDNPPTSPGFRSRLGVRGCNTYKIASTWFSELLQTGHRKFSFENWGRSGWIFTSGLKSKSPRQEKGGILTLDRVDSVEIFKQGGGGEFERLCPGGVVYNVEVSNGSTYFADGLLVHNCHHAISDSWQTVLGHFAPHAKILGVTATPDRGDRRSLGEFFQNIAADVGLFELINLGYLSPIRVKSVPLKIDISCVGSKAGDLDETQLGHALEPYLRQIALAVREHASFRRVLAFLPLIATSQSFVSYCNDVGLKARHIDGTSPDRKEILAKYSAGEYDVLSNAMLLTEGYDDPMTDCIVVLRPTKSRPLFTQMVGRGTRIDPLKTDCISEGSLVLTDHGEIPIERVTMEMKVWDGCCFVSHGGAIYKGEQETITYQGLTATPNHFCWTKKGWQTLEMCKQRKIQIAVTAEGRRSIREVESFLSSSKKRERHLPNADAVLDLQKGILEEQRIGPEGNCGVSHMREASNCSAVALGKIQSGKATMHEPQVQDIQGLWGKRDTFQIQISHNCWTVGDGKPWTPQGASTRPHKERRSLRAWEHSILNQRAEFIPHKKAWNIPTLPPVQAKASGSEVRRPNFIQADWNGAFVPSDSKTLEYSIQKTKRRVWDILNCGPLHRFTVSGLLVHNCLLLDFLWHHERHRLMRPASLIAKDDAESDAITAKLAKAGGEDEDLQDATSDVREERESKLADELRKKAKRGTRVISPGEFARMMGDDSFLSYEPEMKWEEAPITQGQRDYLNGFGIDLDEIRGRGHASKFIGILMERQQLDLATPKQIRMLRAFGVKNPEQVNFSMASHIIGTNLERKKAAAERKKSA